MKKFSKIVMSTTLTGALLFSGIGVAGAASFHDVKDGFWADDEINYLYEEKINSGFPNGNFMVYQFVTKSQVAGMLSKALDLKPSKDSKIEFKDVKKKHGAYNAIVAVVEAGIFPHDEKFNPNAPLTKAEVAEIFVKAFKLKGSSSVELKDVPKTSDYYDEISPFIENDLAVIGSNQKFNPNQEVTRAEFAVFLARALNPDFLPNQYNIAQNVNPVIKLFDLLFKNPKDISTLFALKNDYGFSDASEQIVKLEVSEFKEIGRLNGTTEFVVQLNIDLKGDKAGLLVDGKNILYFLIQKDDYMDFSIVSVDQKPHLKGNDSITFTSESAIKLVSDSRKAYWYVVSGGEGTGEIKTFTKDELEYRYMAESLDTEAKLKAYLAQTYTPAQVEKMFKDLGFITHDGKLAQPNADGGSLLDFEKATAKLISNSTTVKKYELKVPLGETNEVQTMIAELRFVEGKGWRVHSLVDTSQYELSNETALVLFAESNKAYWTAVAGGEGEGEIQTFNKGGMEYRYMLESLNTEERLRTYLGQYYTPGQVEKLFKDLGFITHKGKLAQPNADGGSLLNFANAKIELVLDSMDVKKYKLTVPLGDTGLVETMEGELHFVENEGWRVHSLK
ncbi:DL-endopeptidase inhibitor IseA family protein [Ureibacillus acetophenoni]|uniref:S-layer family protein n=1 Tax=Ureibacillus acetophenoni TaxID=614649 RepID=A0A285UIG3_9BACL|nr:DL-endopeptidase inhibitor IseA family protein [Ureibacillus acetophenoni]SOC40041.1 S-layer family protein [Ureibacillus acetophenoni]